MSEQYPQIFEGVLDAILDGRETRQAQLADMLGKVCMALGANGSGGPTLSTVEDADNWIAGHEFSNRWTKASQIARLTAAKAFLVPKVGQLLTTNQLAGRLSGTTRLGPILDPA